MPHALELSGSPALALNDFGLSFHEKVVLQSVTFDLAPQGCHVLLGPSGTGKSALLRTLAGFNDAHPASQSWGKALYQGRALTPDNRPPLMVQKAQLMVATVLDNLQSGLPDRARMTRAAQLERIAHTVESLGETWVTAAFASPVVNLNLRQQRAVSILRASLADPAVLMLDEPTTGMGEADAQRLIDLIKRLSRQRCLLVVMHHLAQTRSMADQVLLLASGRVQEHADVQAFFDAPQSAAAQQFVRTGSCPEAVIEPLADTDLAEQEPESPLPATAPQPSGLTSLGNPPAQALRKARSDAAAPSRPAKSAACGPRGFVWLMPGELAGTPWPGIIRDMDDDLGDLQRVGITRLVNLTEKELDPQALKRYDIQSAWLPIPDMQAPTATLAARLCADIDAWLNQSEVVALHCRGGLGRTGTLLAAYWLWHGHGERTAVEAVERIRQLNQHMIQSSEQVQFLERFSTWLTQPDSGLRP